MWESYSHKRTVDVLVGPTGIWLVRLRRLSVAGLIPELLIGSLQEGLNPCCAEKKRKVYVGCARVVGMCGNGQRSTGSGRGSSGGVWGGALIEGSFEIPPAAGDQSACARLQWRPGRHRKPAHSTEVPCDNEEPQRSGLQSLVMQVTCLGGGAEDSVWLPEAANETWRESV